MADSIYEDGRYLGKNPDWHASDAPYKARWIADILKANHIGPESIAEVGCGSGQVLLGLDKYFPGSILSGFDISPQAIKICQSYNSDRATFLNQDIRLYDGDVFDLLLIIDVFEHVDDYIGFIKSIKNVATYKVFHIPLDLSVQTLLRSTPIMRARDLVGHLHYFYKDSALATLKSAGYEVVDWSYTHFSQQLPARGIKTRMLNIPRAIIQAMNEDFSVRMFGGSSLLVVCK